MPQGIKLLYQEYLQGCFTNKKARIGLHRLKLIYPESVLKKQWYVLKLLGYKMLYHAVMMKENVCCLLYIAAFQLWVSAPSDDLKAKQDRY